MISANFPAKLFLVATDLDSQRGRGLRLARLGRRADFPGVQASSALPGLFPPVDIGGRSYVDGALTKTLTPPSP